MTRTPDPSDEPVVAQPAEDDTEGHSLSLVMGLDALGRTRERDRTRVARPSDEELAPLTKTFPRLKDDRKR